MMTQKSWARLVWLGALGAPLTVSAQADSAPATGFSMWARVAQSSVQELAASATGSPEFTVGYRGERISVGLGIGLARLRVTDRDEFGTSVSESKTTATLFQVGPDVLVRVWESDSRRTQGNLAFGATIGRLSAKDEDSFTGSPPTESTASGTLYGVRLGLGGEHFLDRHFAIGVEGGFQGMFATDIEEDGVDQSVGVGVSGAYGALRLTVVLGS